MMNRIEPQLSGDAVVVATVFSKNQRSLSFTIFKSISFAVKCGRSTISHKIIFYLISIRTHRSIYWESIRLSVHNMIWPLLYTSHKKTRCKRVYYEPPPPRCCCCYCCCCSVLCVCCFFLAWICVNLLSCLSSFGDKSHDVHSSRVNEFQHSLAYYRVINLTQIGP